MYSNCLCINSVVFPKGSFTNYVSQFFHIFDPPPSLPPPPCQHMSEFQRPPSSLMSENSYPSPTPFSEKFSKIRLTSIFSIYLHHTYTIFKLNSKKLINPLTLSIAMSWSFPFIIILFFSIGWLFWFIFFLLILFWSVVVFFAIFIYLCFTFSMMHLLCLYYRVI